MKLLWQKKTLKVLTLSILFILCIAYGAMAADYPVIEWPRVQNRVYEDGTMNNYLGFALLYNDGSGYTPPTDLEFGDVNLYSPFEPVIPLPLQNWWGGTYTEHYASYDGTTFNYSGPDTGNWFSAHINQSLVPGEYTLMVSGDEYGGWSDSALIPFNYDSAGIPVVRSTSFNYYFNGSGFYWEWDVPTIPSGVGTSVRATLQITTVGEAPADLVVTIPTSINHLYIPDFTTDELEALRLQIQLRTDDNNFRTYSDRVWVEDFTAVPEPATILLLGSGLGFLGIVRKKRKMKKI